MGYRLAGIRLGQVTTYLDASEPRDSTSRVKERTTVTWLLLQGEQKIFQHGYSDALGKDSDVMIVLVETDMWRHSDDIPAV